MSVQRDVRARTESDDGRGHARAAANDPAWAASPDAGRTPASSAPPVAPTNVVDAHEVMAEVGDFAPDRPSRVFNRGNAERLVSVLSPVFLLALWQAGTVIPGAEGRSMIDTRFFPAPTTIFGALWQMIQSGELWGHVGVSLQRIVIGFLIGAVPGVVLGLLMGLIPLVRAAIQPLVDATFPIPKIAILPLFIMIFGIGEESKYAIIAVAVIYLVLINTVAGVRNIDKIYLDVGKNYHANQRLMFTDVALPGALPLIVAGLKLGMGVALLVIVAAEFVGAKSGIGYLIWTSWQVFQVEKMYVGLLISAILGFGSAILLNWLERVLIPWKHR